MLVFLSGFAEQSRYYNLNAISGNRKAED
ncbi:MAG: hypothetical protein QOJ42_6418, partial [Acidobacteriaceae bacterium]|nr:hypothetical protein [Acidobacteriaceae bacterium]